MMRPHFIFNKRHNVPGKEIISRQIKGHRNHLFPLAYPLFIFPADKGYHSPVQFMNLLLFFQYGNELSRNKEPEIRILPASQHFHAAECHIDRPHYRLIVHLNPSPGNRLFQMPFNIPRKGNLLFQCPVIISNPFPVRSGQAAAGLHSVTHTYTYRKFPGRHEKHPDVHHTFPFRGHLLFQQFPVYFQCVIHM